MGSDGQNDILILIGVVGMFFYLVFSGAQFTRPTANDGLFKTGDFVKVNSIFAGNQEKLSQGYDQSAVFYLSDYITLESGNARGETNSGKEYVVIKASNQMPRPVQVSGWSLENGGGERLYDQGNKVVRGVTKRVTIPYGTYLLSGEGTDQVYPIFLQPGGRVVVSTGKPTAIRSEFEIDTSFQENICTGYVEDFKSYDFSPSLERSCRDPEKEINQTGLSNACRDFIEDNIRTCHTPIFKDHQIVNGEKEKGDFMDGREVDISKMCRNYIEDHYSYRGCLKYYVTDPDFLTGDWRVYLRETWELWANKDEHIKLYDQHGSLIDELKY
jgi:hypothetical protein